MMEVASTVAEMRTLRRAMAGGVGFVPTLGYLHAGHRSLLRAARAQNEHTVASIFVNPTQFNQPEDFDSYPRDTENDQATLREEGVDAVFTPSVDEMYPDGPETTVEVGDITDRLEGAHRPGHFAGVTTIVSKLFDVVEPTRAYFGQKDAQQLAVIRRMVRDLGLSVEIVAMPTIREADGLAMSSRNARLSTEERAAALVLANALRLAGASYRSGERNASTMRDAMLALIAAQPLARVDYVSVADTTTLAELTSIEAAALVSLAVQFGDVRLIDNITLPPADGDLR